MHVKSKSTNSKTFFTLAIKRGSIEWDFANGCFHLEEMSPFLLEL